MFSIQAIGLKETITKFNDARQMGWYKNTLNKIGKLMRDEVQRMAPRDTGAMEQSIELVVDDEGIEIIVPVPYAVFNEYGTRYMPVGDEEKPLMITSRSGKLAFRPFVRPAMLKIIREHGDDFGKELLKILSHG